MIVIKDRCFDDVEFRDGIADLSDVHFINCSFKGADFRHVILTSARFSRCDLDRASFQEASAEGICFESCSVRYTDWTGSDLTHMICISGGHEADILAGSLTKEDSERKQEIEKNGVDLQRTVCVPSPHSFRDSAFRNADLSGAILIGCDFTGTNFQSARLHSTCLKNSKFIRAVLSDASFGWEEDFRPDCDSALCSHDCKTGACECRFEDTKFDEAHARRADFEKVAFRGTSFEHTDLQRAVLTESHFDNTKMAGALLSNALAEKAIFVAVNLTGAVLREIQLHGAEFRSNIKNSASEPCSLIGVDAAGADLSNAKLEGAKANAARFYAAALNEADLSNAKVEGSIFERADLSGANLTGIDAEEANFSQVQFSGTTKLGKGKFSFTTFSGVTFPAGIDVAEAVFRSAIMDGVAFGIKEDQTNLTKPTLLTKVDFYDANLAGAAFFPGCVLDEVQFLDANLTSVSFGNPAGSDNTTESDDKNICLTTCDFSDSRLERTSWNYAEVHNCTFTNCTWNSTNIDQCNFYVCRLNRIEIRSSELKNTKFIGCRFSASNFAGSILKIVNISSMDENMRKHYGEPLEKWYEILLCIFDETEWNESAITGVTYTRIFFQQCSFHGALFNDCDIKNSCFKMCDFSESAIGATFTNVSHYRSHFHLASLAKINISSDWATFLNCFFEVTPLPQDMGKIIFYRCQLIGDGVLPPREDGNGDHPPNNLPFLLDCTVRHMFLPTWHIGQTNHLRKDQSTPQNHNLRNLASRILEMPEDAIETVISSYEAFGRTPHARELATRLNAEPKNLSHHFAAQFWHALRDNFIGIGEATRVGSCIKEYRYQQLLSLKPDFVPLRLRRTANKKQCLGLLGCITHFSMWSLLIIAFCVGVLSAAGSSFVIKIGIPGPPFFVGTMAVMAMGILWFLRSNPHSVGYLSLIVFQFGESAKLILLNASMLIFFFACAFWFVPAFGGGIISGPPSTEPQTQALQVSGDLELDVAPDIALQSTISSEGNIQMNGCSSVIDGKANKCDAGEQSVRSSSGFRTSAAMEASGSLAMKGMGTLQGQFMFEAPKSEISGPAFMDCLYFSAVTFSTMGYSDMRLDGALRFLAAIEALIGAFAMALFVFAFTRGTAER